MSGSVDAVEVAAKRLSAGLKRLHATKSVEQRRQIVIEDVGRLVGRLDAAMERAAAGRKPHERALLDVVRDKAVGDAIGVLLSTCEWEVRS
jgi:hypothetical protein